VTETHVLDLPTRKGKVEISEHSDHVLVTVTFDKTGEDFGDGPQIQEWLLSIFRKFEKDKRPVLLNNAVTGEQAVIITRDSL
jgi:hypothetical protein